MTSNLLRLLGVACLLALVELAAGCSCAPSGGADAGSDGGVLDGGRDAGSTDAGPLVFTDFASTPTLAAGVPENVAALFGVADTAGTGPCLVEPSLGALVPANWTPLWLEWTAASLNVFEVRLHVDNQANDYLAYTTSTAFELPVPVWNALTLHSAGHDIAVTLRGGQLGASGSTVLTQGPLLGASGVIHLAPVMAQGTIVYWTTSNGSALKGFDIGQPQPKVVLTPALSSRPGAPTKCIGCHTSSPDGALAFFTASPSGLPPFGIDATSADGVAQRATDGVISSAAVTLLSRTDQSTPTLSAAHYSPTDAVAITTLKSVDTSNKTELVWTDLHAGSTTGGWGVLPRTGDTLEAALPSFAHDGESIVYVSSSTVIDGRTSSAPTDVMIVPFNNRAGGTARKLVGASEADKNETYPVYSPDDALVAFNRMPVGNTYNEKKAEVFLVSADGGTALRIAANDPPTCTNKVSPGLTNSWPRWAPQVQTVAGKKYYWLTFSSQRRGTLPQLFVAGVVVDSAGAVTTYPAVYVRSQVSTEANHTPAWDVFDIGIE